MRFEDSFAVDAPIDVVWSALEDIPRVSGCMPGVESVEPAGPDAYRGHMKVSVGPIAARFAGHVRVLERAPLERIVAEVEAKDQVTASSIRATFEGRLSGEADRTEVRYAINVTLRGRLAQFGAAIVQAVAKKKAAEFAACLQEMLSS